EQVEHRLRLFASASVDRQSRVLAALRARLGAMTVELLDQLPFKAQNRFSAVRVEAESELVLVLGACEALRDCLAAAPPEAEAAWIDMSQRGLRVLLFAEAENRQPLDESLPHWPLRPLALASFSDRVRPEAAPVLAALARQGIAVKVLSGDHPGTVHATVAPLAPGLADAPVLSGEQLANAPNLAELARSHNVFGRIAPEQKLMLVQGLQKCG